MSSYIEVKNVAKSFSGRAILQNISLPVEQGTTVGLVGANGSGKSVLFKIICGFEKPDQGSVYVRGRQIGKNGRDFPADMGVFINSPGFIGIYSGFQNLKFLADIQGKIGEKEIRQTMTKVGLDPDNKAKVSRDHRLQHSEDQCANNRSRHTAEAADHSANKRFVRQVSHCRISCIFDAKKYTGKAGHGTSDDKYN